MNSSRRSSSKSSRTRRCDTGPPPFFGGGHEDEEAGDGKGHLFSFFVGEGNRGWEGGGGWREGALSLYFSLDIAILQDEATGTDGRNNTPATGERSRRRNTVSSASFSSFDLPRRGGGALLTEHDVLSSKSCSHLPRHTHTHTHSLFHLSSSEQRNCQGSIAPPTLLVLFFFKATYLHTFSGAHVSSFHTGQHLSVLFLNTCSGSNSESVDRGEGSERSTSENIAKGCGGATRLALLSTPPLNLSRLLTAACVLLGLRT